MSSSQNQPPNSKGKGKAAELTEENLTRTSYYNTPTSEIKPGNHSFDVRRGYRRGQDSVIKKDDGPQTYSIVPIGGGRRNITNMADDGMEADAHPQDGVPSAGLEPAYQDYSGIPRGDPKDRSVSNMADDGMVADAVVKGKKSSSSEVQFAATPEFYEQNRSRREKRSTVPSPSAWFHNPRQRPGGNMEDNRNMGTALPIRPRWETLPPSTARPAGNMAEDSTIAEPSDRPMGPRPMNSKKPGQSSTYQE
jgi:hypothetical protein